MFVHCVVSVCGFSLCSYGCWLGSFYCIADVNLMARFVYFCHYLLFIVVSDGHELNIVSIWIYASSIWNVWDLNNPTCLCAIQNQIKNINCNLIYIHENKIVDFLISLVCEKLGNEFCDNFIFKAVDGKMGAIIIACSQDFSIATMTTVSGRHPLSADIADKSDGSS